MRAFPPVLAAPCSSPLGPHAARANDLLRMKQERFPVRWLAVVICSRGRGYLRSPARRERAAISPVAALRPLAHGGREAGGGQEGVHEEGGQDDGISYKQ